MTEYTYSGKKCDPGCRCKKHQGGSKKCEPSCTCGRHRKRTQEERLVLSKKTKESWKDQHVRSLRSESIKRAHSDPKWKAKHSEIMREINSRPEVRAKLTGRPKIREGHWATQSLAYYLIREEKGNTECDICGLPNFSKSKKRHHVDHNHRTGSIRGLLCSRCNGIVGHIEKGRASEISEEWLRNYNESALAYLKEEDFNE